MKRIKKLFHAFILFQSAKVSNSVCTYVHLIMGKRKTFRSNCIIDYREISSIEFSAQEIHLKYFPRQLQMESSYKGNLLKFRKIDVKTANQSCFFENTLSEK